MSNDQESPLEPEQEPEVNLKGNKWMVSKMENGKRSYIHIGQAIKILPPREYIARCRQKQQWASKLLPAKEPRNSEHIIFIFNYKSICRQLQQKNQRLGKAYQDLKAQFDELEDSCQEREEQLAQAQQDADEMADMVRKNPSMVCGSAVYPEREEMQAKQRLHPRRHNTKHDKRLHRDSRAKNCQ